MTTIILIPGLMCDGAVWAGQIGSLSRLAPVHIALNDGLDDLGDMAERLLDQVGGALFVAGHSMGGRVALEVAARAPDRVAALALISTGAHGPRAVEQDSRGALVSLAHSRGMAAVAEHWLPNMIAPATAPDIRRAIVDMLLRSTPEGFAAQQRALLNRTDRTALLGGLRAPTLVMTGEYDGWADPAQHRAMAEEIPGALCAIVPAAGHMLPMEAPKATAERLQQFFRTA